jgi:hypothetical protein
VNLSVAQTAAAQPTVSPFRSGFVIVAAVLLAILAAVWIGSRFRTQPPAKPIVDSLEAQQRQALQDANARIASHDLNGALAVLQQAEALNGSLTPEVKETLSRVRALKSKDDEQAQLRQTLERQLTGSLEQRDFQSARRAADQLKQNGGNPADLLAAIDREEQRDLKDWEAQFEEAKGGKDPSTVQQLKRLRTQFQSVANDGGPQSEEASNYFNKVSAAIRAREVPGRKTTTSPRCEALTEQVQLGGTLNEEERVFLRDNCQR